MHRRSFFAALPALATSPALALDPLHGGDRITGAKFAGRSTVWGTQGAAATAHPLASLIGIDILRQGGSAIDAAIAINAALGFLEPIACGIGGDAYLMLWDPAQKTVVGFNGSGRSPKGMSLDYVRSKAKNGHIPSWGSISVSVPGAVDTWGQMHARYGKLKFADVLAPAIALCERGVPVAQTIAFYLNSSYRRFTNPDSGIEEVQNFLKVYAPNGRTPREGEIFRNPDLARTYRYIAENGARSFYEGQIADTIDAYFRRISGHMRKSDLIAHHGEDTTPLKTTYRGVEVLGLGANTQGLSTLQMMNILETFDLKGMGFQTTTSLHTQIEAKRLAFEDRAKFFGDPAFSNIPVETLLSKAYAQEQAAKIRQDAILPRIVPYEAPARGDTTYFTVSDKDGMMVSWIQSNYRGMGSGLIPDGLGFMLQDRGELFSLRDGSPNIYAPGKRPFHTIIPGFACKNGQPWLSFGVMGGDMQPQGQAQILVNLIDYGLGLQEAGDAPRWHHEGSSEPTGEAAEGTGTLNLESGVPLETRIGLEKLGWSIKPSPGNYGGYQAIVTQTEPLGRAYGAATEMRKDGLALAY
ncbi:gamma-glutamyltransferase family protein [Asticcacaulis excentricus]|uniref:Gamma-glutamyltransferase n=1 Tax=Asticcacaulis excentricus (strain ATCC 15261 / DSM 4724 / KCTC 12464 / NCIMB 9791 / VKM B-1370 / CB 48) TaxID=573065 RepID=E8RQQ7_ASTEC|nr:gamma-glutamyltransferase family protein [Asticcacaulis excentricus]ADU13285.1 Gamma-glutamyltransferase [Asticcacaulis excentricus CB 48]